MRQEDAGHPEMAVYCSASGSLSMKKSPKGSDNFKFSAGSTPSRWGNKSFIPHGEAKNRIELDIDKSI